jgi:hypothetical protein
MQDDKSHTYDPVTAYLAVCGVSSPVSKDSLLQDRVRDLFSFYGSDATGEHISPTRPFMLDQDDADFEFFLDGDAEEREQILERRIILQINELTSRTHR